MKDFADWLRRHQVAWRQQSVSIREMGSHNRREHEWILPAPMWTEGLWPGIREGTESLPDYLETHGIHKHTGANNLKSSWILCANLYFPFRTTPAGRRLLAGFLQAHVAAEVQTVDAVELEYAEEQAALRPEQLLGEAGGTRGTGQTSPDLAFLVNGRRGLLLVESKLAEHSFYGCSARRESDRPGRPGNPDRGRCNDALGVHEQHAFRCHQIAWGRRYWTHLEPVVDRNAWASLRCCPAAHAGYQLFRQQALAEGLAASGKYEFVWSCVALDARNEALRQSLTGTGLSDVRDWARLFRGKAHFAVFEHQQWVAWVRDHDAEGRWRDWLSYVEGRYGYAPVSDGPATAGAIPGARHFAQDAE